MFRPKSQIAPRQRLRQEVLLQESGLAKNSSQTGSLPKVFVHFLISGFDCYVHRITLNGAETITNFRVVTGTDFLAGTGAVNAPTIDIRSGGNLNFTLSQ